MHTLAKNVQTLLLEHDIVPEELLLLCALSGGADSVALALVLQELGYEVEAMHCNFQLRGEESERDEQFVRDFCKEHDIPLHVTRFDTRAEAEKRGESIEMAARRLRYKWFEDVADDRDGIICVAHHADDNVETMLLNLIRGAGLHGLTGMRFINDWGILRPLLTTTRAEIIGYLAERGQSFVTDSTNTDTHYRRNKVRHELLPLLREMNPSIDRTLTETMFHLRQTEDFLDLADDSETFRTRRQLMSCGFSMTQIIQMEDAREGAYVTTTHHPKFPGREVMLTKHQGELEVGLVPVPLAPTPLLQGFTRLPDYGTSLEGTGVTFCAQRISADGIVSLRDRYRVYLDVRALQGRIYVRSVQRGERFRPFGMRGTKLVSDYMTDRKRSRLDKAAALAVCDDNGILWLVGETIDQRAAVTDSTTEVLCIMAEPMYKE